MSLSLLIGIPLLVGISMQGAIAVVTGKKYEAEVAKVMEQTPSVAAVLSKNIEEQKAMGPIMQTMSLLVLVGGLLTALSASRRFAQRFAHLGEATNKMAEGALDVDFDRVRDVEFDALLGDFDVMRQKLHERIELEVERTELGKAMELGAEVQRMFLPSHAELGHPRIRASAAYRPAATCGGDFWFSHLAADGRLIVLVGDVTGHGSAAAVVTASVATQVRMQLARNDSIEGPRLLSNLNASLLDLCSGSYRMTMVVLEIDAEAQTLKVHSAGAPPVMLREESGAIESLTIAGTPLGTLRFAATSAERSLSKSSRIHVFTDGLTEAQREDGRAYGLRRAAKCLGQLQDVPVDAVCDSLFRSVDAFAEGAPQDDDWTMLTMEVL